MRRARVPEKAVQQQIVALLRSLGAAVYVLGTRRPRGDACQSTRQTPGIPDLYVLGLRGRALWIECKAEGGRLSPAQEAFRDGCAVCGVSHVVGGLTDVVRWLVEQGLLSASALSAERQARLAPELVCRVSRCGRAVTEGLDVCRAHKRRPYASESA